MSKLHSLEVEGERTNSLLNTPDCRVSTLWGGGEEKSLAYCEQNQTTTVNEY